MWFLCVSFPFSDLFSLLNITSPRFKSGFSFFSLFFFLFFHIGTD